MCQGLLTMSALNVIQVVPFWVALQGFIPLWPHDWGKGCPLENSARHISHWNRFPGCHLAPKGLKSTGPVHWSLVRYPLTRHCVSSVWWVVCFLRSWCLTVLGTVRSMLSGLRLQPWGIFWLDFLFHALCLAQKMASQKVSHRTAANKQRSYYSGKI